MSREEPDDTPVTREHVQIFLAWYRSRVPLPTWAGIDDMWFNALHTLTLGELRHGMRSFARFTSHLALDPPQFWGLCRGTDNELTIQRFREMREKIAAGKVRVAPAYQPRKGREADKPGASHD